MTHTTTTPDATPITEATEPALFPYFVLYRERPDTRPADPPLGFGCQAEDAEHAEEQFINAHPELADDVVWVSAGALTINDAWADYYRDDSDRESLPDAYLSDDRDLRCRDQAPKPCRRCRNLSVTGLTTIARTLGMPPALECAIASIRQAQALGTCIYVNPFIGQGPAQTR